MNEETITGLTISMIVIAAASALSYGCHEVESSNRKKMEIKTELLRSGWVEKQNIGNGDVHWEKP